MSVKNQINKLLVKAEDKAKKTITNTVKETNTISSVVNAATKTVNPTTASLTNTANSAIKTVTTSAKAATIVTSTPTTKTAAEKVVQNTLDKIIDDAVNKAKIGGASKAETEINDQVKNIVRGYKNTFFNQDKLISSITGDTKKQLDLLVDKKLKETLNADNISGKSLGSITSGADLSKVVNTKLVESVRTDVVKDLNNVVSSTLEKEDSAAVANLVSKNKNLTSQIDNLKSKLATNITKDIGSSFSVETKKIELRQKQVLEVKNLKAAAEKLNKDQINTVKAQVTAQLKAEDQKLIDDIKKSVKIDF